MKKMPVKVLLFSCLILSFSLQNASAKIETVLGIPLNKNPDLILEAPTTAAPEIILSRDQYVLSYNKEKRSPNWVSWKLESSNMGTSGRSNDFAMDEELSNYLQESSSNKPAVDLNEYKGSCYDRGHQIPSADRTDTLPDNQATFLMSNMIPQTPYLNRMIWEHLEQYSRNLVQKKGKKLYIISGPIYDRDLGSIGPNKDIPVPSKDFKIIFVLNSDQDYTDITTSTETIAVIMPNILKDGTYPDKNLQGACKTLDTEVADLADWEQYKTTIQEIEKVSGVSISFQKNK